MTRVKGSDRRPFMFIFGLNIFLSDLFQVHENIMEIEEWKQKCSSHLCQKLELSFIKPVRDINCILQKLDFKSDKFDYS